MQQKARAIPTNQARLISKFLFCRTPQPTRTGFLRPASAGFIFLTHQSTNNIHPMK
jgi:hypothetical protein